MSTIDEFLDRAGAGAVLMIADGETFDDVLANTPADQWGRDGNWRTYRGARVEIHDEWSWGWMVRRADGGFVERLAQGIEARSDETPAAAQPEGQEPGSQSECAQTPDRSPS